MEKSDSGTTLVDGGYLIWTYGPDVQKRMGWQQVLWNFTIDTGRVLILDGGSTYRKQYYPDYKSARREKWEEADPERIAKRESVFEFANKILEPDPRLAVVKYLGLEADDIIAAWCIRHPDQVDVIGTDKDLVQLGDRNIRLKRHDGTPVTAESFRKSLPKTIRPFVSASKVLLVIALLGDKSDSIPRLVPPGLKELKQFAKLLQEPTAWELAIKEYGEDEVKRNLYLSILPGPWVFENIPSPDDVLEMMIKVPALYYRQMLREDIEAGYRKYLTMKKKPEEILKELGYDW